MKTNVCSGFRILSYKCISNYWLIILAVLFSSILYSCVSPSTVRNSNGVAGRNPIVKKEKEQKRISNPQNEQNTNYSNIDEINEFGQLITSKNSLGQKNNNINNDNDLSDVFQNIPDENRLPTLREQMNNLATEQSILKEQINNIQTDVEDVKNMLEAIAGTVINSDNNAPLKGISKNNRTSSNQSVNSDFIILPDEKVEQNEQTDNKPLSNTTSKNKETNKNNTVNPNTPIEQNNYEQNDYENAIKLYEQKNYQQAIIEFDKLLKSVKNTDTKNEVEFYKGMSFFHIEDYLKASQSFEAIINSNSQKNKPAAQLYLAESNIRIGKNDKARTLYKQLIANYPDSKFVPQARKMLQQL